MKIPPRTTFAVQLSATCVAACIQVAMLRLLETVVPDLCSRDQAALLSCPVARITYNASLIWYVSRHTLSSLGSAESVRTGA